MLLERILVATDFSSTSNGAMQAAVALATRTRTKLVVLHVIEDDAYSFPFPAPAAAEQGAQSRVDRVIAGMQDVAASSVIRRGFAWSEICSAATELAADLIVLGTQGRRGLPRLVMGSVAERVVRLAAAPVLTVPPSKREPGRFRQILAPTDFSELSMKGVELAVAFAIELRAHLTLVHVCEPQRYPYVTDEEVVEPDLSPRGKVDELTNEAEARSRRELDNVVKRVATRLPLPGAFIRRGAPWRGILEVAEDMDADLITLSTHGRHGLQRVLIGSVAEKIVRMSPVPVLTVGANVQRSYSVL